MAWSNMAQRVAIHSIRHAPNPYNPTWHIRAFQNNVPKAYVASSFKTQTLNPDSMKLVAGLARSLVVLW